MREIVFPFSWMDSPPQGSGIPLDRWVPFAESMAGWVVAVCVATTLLAVVAYTIHARRKKVRAASDLFAAYTPLWWLALAALAAVTMAVAYPLSFRSAFPTAPVSPVGATVLVTLWTCAWTLLLSYLLIQIPGLTPPTYRYRPRAWLARGRHLPKIEPDREH